MRKALAGIAAGAVVATTGWIVMPRTVGAQGGGTIEVEVKYNGPAQVETIKVNKDTEQCGKEAKVEKVVVGGNKGLANAVDRKSTRLNSSHQRISRMPSSA